MDQNDGSNFQELNALLNWSPDGEMTTMGEVRTFLERARHLLRLMEEKHEMALVAIGLIGGVVAKTEGVMSEMLLNVSAIAALLDHQGDAMEHCLSRDIILMETFLDAFAGNDRTGDGGTELPF